MSITIIWYYDFLAGFTFPGHPENQEREALLLSSLKAFLLVRNMKKSSSENVTRTLKDNSGPDYYAV